MKKRGRVLRDTSAGPGLIVVDGQQYPFQLESIWRSEVPPRAGLVADVAFNKDGSIAFIIAVAESQLAKEQTEQAMAMAREKGGALVSSVVAKFGMPTLIATGLLIIGWFFLTTISYNGGFVGKMDFTFWHILSFINASNAMEALSTMTGSGSTGFYGFLAILALAGPFLAYFWKDKRAQLGGTLPLLFMLLVALLVRHSISSAIGAGASGTPSPMETQMMDMARKEMMKAISIGMGAWISLLAAIYLGFNSVKNFLVAKASN
jgi:hypothetical protein